jgi:hypothetical protein
VDSNQRDLTYDLTSAASTAGNVFHGAGATYLKARGAHAPAQEIITLVENCIITGELYKTSLDQLLSNLQTAEPRDEKFIERINNLIQRLEVEVADFVRLRRANLT